MNIFEKEIVNECEMCGNKTIFPQTAEDIVVCRLCSMKLKMAKWKDRTYSDNEEVEKQKQEVLRNAAKYQCPQSLTDHLERFFDAKKIEGLVKTVDGNSGQKLILFEDHFVIETTSAFDHEWAKQCYQSILSGKRGKSISPDEYEKVKRFLSSPSAVGMAETLVLTALPGGKMKKFAALGKGLLDTYQAQQNSLRQDGREETLFYQQLKGGFEVRSGEQRLSYREVKAIYRFEPVGEEEAGFILFQRQSEQNIMLQPAVFFFDNRTDLKKEVHRACDYIEKTAASLRAKEKEAAKRKDRQVSAADEILKYKQLFDLGAISQEEYDAKKKQLLDLS